MMTLFVLASILIASLVFAVYFLFALAANEEAARARLGAADLYSRYVLDRLSDETHLQAASNDQHYLQRFNMRQLDLLRRDIAAFGPWRPVAWLLWWGIRTKVRLRAGQNDLRGFIGLACIARVRD